MSKRALISGISGQDGAYLARLLLRKGYEVWGSSRDAESTSFANLTRLGIRDEVRLVSLKLEDLAGVSDLLNTARPDEVYSLSGQSSVGLSFERPVETVESIACCTLNLLDAIRVSNRDIKLYNAGSTEMFGDTGDTPAEESTAFRPRSPYAIAKATACWLVENYRDAYGVYACSGILSNHDSPLRPTRYVTSKVIHAVAEIARGERKTLKLGNLCVERDWGWAPEYMGAVWTMMQQEQPRDYIIATGRTYKLEEFVSSAFECIGKDWREHVELEANLLRPTDFVRSHMNPIRVWQELGWRAQFDMHDVVRMMLESVSSADLSRAA